MKELEKTLKQIIGELKLITELTKKYGAAQVSKKLVRKDIEDDILKKISNANISQLNNMKKNIKHYFQYYDEEYAGNIINIEIKRQIRIQKLNTIIDE